MIAGIDGQGNYVETCSRLKKTLAFLTILPNSKGCGQIIRFMNNTFLQTMTAHQEEGSLLKDPRFWVIVFALALFAFRVLFGSEPGVVTIP